jgi:hypothetical protein
MERVNDKKSGFVKSLLKTVDKELKRSLEEVAALVIYNYSESNLSLKPEDIPKKMDAFVNGFDVLMNSGAEVVEGVILENLYSNFGFNFRAGGDFSFVDYVNELKNLVG